MQLLQSRCKDLEDGRSQDSALISQLRQTIARLEDDLVAERGRGSTLEEELNAALLEKKILNKELESAKLFQELGSVKMESPASTPVKRSAYIMVGGSPDSLRASPKLLPPLQSPTYSMKGTPRHAPSSTALPGSLRGTPRLLLPGSLRGTPKLLPPLQSPITLAKPSTPVQPNSVSEWDTKSAINSILSQLESFLVSTPKGQVLSFDMDSLDIELDSIGSDHTEVSGCPRQGAPPPHNGNQTSASQATDHTHLLDRSLCGLRLAYQLIQMLSSINANLEGRIGIARSVDDNHVRSYTLKDPP